jgi:hypothetical protein
MAAGLAEGRSCHHNNLCMKTEDKVCVCVCDKFATEYSHIILWGLVSFSCSGNLPEEARDRTENKSNKRKRGTVVVIRGY